MAQINLLRQNTSEKNWWLLISKNAVKILAVAFIALLAYYAWLFIDAGSTAKSISQEETKIASEKQEALSLAGRDEVLVRQQQVAGLKTVVDEHLYWSQLFPELARVTLKTAKYSNIKADTTGNLSLTVIVPSFEDLDKYLQVFDLPAFNQNFSNLRIGGYHLVQRSESGSVVSFDVTMKYSPAVLQYQSIASK